MILDFRCEREALVRCSVKSWPDKNAAAGTLFYSFGTLPDFSAAYKHALSAAILSAEQTFQKAFDSASTSMGSGLIERFTVAIQTAIQEINDRLHQARALLGQGVYLGGAVLARTETEYLAAIFGGAAFYIWDGTTLFAVGSTPVPGTVIQDALGSHNSWHGQIYRGPLQPNTCLLASTHPFTDVTKCSDILAGPADQFPDGKAHALCMTLPAFVLTGEESGILLIGSEE